MPWRVRPRTSLTRGRVDLVRQTLKNWLTRHPDADTVADVQTQLDSFTAYYNHHRPHRALDRHTPAAVWAARPPAIPTRQGIHISKHLSVRKTHRTGLGVARNSPRNAVGGPTRQRATASR